MTSPAACCPSIWQLPNSSIPHVTLPRALQSHQDTVPYPGTVGKALLELLAWSRDRSRVSNSSPLCSCSCTLTIFLVQDHLCPYIAYDISCGLNKVIPKTAFPVLLKNLDRLLPGHKEQQPINQTVTQ